MDRAVKSILTKGVLTKTVCLSLFYTSMEPTINEMLLSEEACNYHPNLSMIDVVIHYYVYCPKSSLN